MHECGAAVSASKLVHCILDNYATHKHPKVLTWLARHSRWTFHLTPIMALWLNAVETFFSALTCRLRRGVFRSNCRSQSPTDGLPIVVILTPGTLRSKAGTVHTIVYLVHSEYARDEDGDGLCKVHINTIEGFWSLLRSWLCLHRGISQEKLPLYLGFFRFVHNACRRGKALLGALVAALVT